MTAIGIGKWIVGAGLKVHALTSAVKNTALIGLVALAIPFAYHVLNRTTIVIQDVSLPAELEARGLSGRIFSHRVIDKILEIANYTDRLKEREDIFGLSRKNQRPDIDLPLTILGVNFETFLTLLKTPFGGRDVRVVAEVTTEVPAGAEDKVQARYAVRIRAGRIGTIYRSKSPTSTIDELTETAAIGIMEEYEPITMAYYYRGRRDFANAYRMTEKAIAKNRDGDELWALFLRGLIEADQRRYGSAEEEFRLVLEKNPAFPGARSQLSRMLRRSGKMEAALVEAEKAVAIEPDKLQGYQNMALALEGLKRADEALVWFRKSVDVDPGNDAGHFEIAAFFRRSPGLTGELSDRTLQLEQAVKHFRLAARLGPFKSGTYANLAGALGDLGRWDEAERITLKAIYENRKDAIALGYIGYIALQKGDYARARNFYIEAYAADPGYFRAHIGLARVAMHEGQLDKADELLSKALTADAAWWDTYKYQGDLALIRGDRGAAIVKYKQALKLSPRAADVHARIAHVAHLEGDDETARRHARRATELAPHFFPSADSVLSDFRIR